MLLPNAEGLQHEGVYLLCLESPLGNAKHQARHYIGWSRNIAGRVWYHMRGKAKVSFTQAAVDRGIAFRVTRTWDGADRTFERRLKNQKNARRLCPLCSPPGSQSCR